MKLKFPNTEAEETPILDALGLAVGTKIRFQRHSGEKWITGIVMGDAKDGSISIVDKTGKWRAIMPEQCQIATEGPRGGKKWISILPDQTTSL